MLKAHSKVWENFWQLQAIKKLWKMLIILSQKLSSFSRYFWDFWDFWAELWINSLNKVSYSLLLLYGKLRAIEIDSN